MYLMLPFTYRVSGRRGRISRVVQNAAFVERDIPETTSDLAPLAATWESAGPRGAYKTACRVFEGSHYTLLEPDPWKRDGELKSNMVTEGRFTCSPECVKALASRMGLESGDELSNFEDICLGRVPSHGRFNGTIDRQVSSDETFRRLRAESLISSFLFIDGLLWVRCNEPKLRLQKSKRGNGSTISMDTNFDVDLHFKSYGHHSLSPSFNLDMFFNLGDFERAKCAAVQIGGGLEKQVTSVTSVGLHRPDLFTFDGDRGSLKTIARELMFKLHGQAGHMDVDTLKDFLHIRDGASATINLDTGETRDCIARLLAAYPHEEWTSQIQKSFDFAEAVIGHGGADQGVKRDRFTPL